MRSPVMCQNRIMCCGFSTGLLEYGILLLEGSLGRRSGLCVHAGRCNDAPKHGPKVIHSNYHFRV